MMKAVSINIIISSIVVLFSPVCFSQNNPYSKWTQSLPATPDYFPIGVWLQSPSDAEAYCQAGVNLYIGLWKGPTIEQLHTISNTEMQVICTQNTTALEWANKKTPNGRWLIAGYLQKDEPDNCQPLPEGGYGPPIPTTEVQQIYTQLHANDPNRPVLLNLGQGIAWDNGTWTGQGGFIDPDRDYPAYLTGSDIGSFDIYPMDCARTQTCGDAWRVALGVDRLYQYSPQGHIIWNIIETSDIHANGKLVTIPQIRAEAWMSIIHGSKGLVYFIHGKTSYSDFDSRTLLRPENADRLTAVKELNNEIQLLTPVIYSTSVKNLVSIQDVTGDSPVDYDVKIHNNITYIFAAGMRDNTTTKRFTLTNHPDATIEVIGEKRTLTLQNGLFTDTFEGYSAHIYKIYNSVLSSSDFTLNGQVNIEDFSVFSKGWLTESTDENWNSTLDISTPPDANVSSPDFIAFVGNWLD